MYVRIAVCLNLLYQGACDDLLVRRVLVLQVAAPLLGALVHALKLRERIAADELQGTGHVLRRRYGGRLPKTGRKKHV